MQRHKDAKGHVMREEHRLVQCDQYRQCKERGQNKAGEAPRSQVKSHTAAVCLEGWILSWG